MKYFGTHEIKIDDKGRLFVPAQYRADFVENAKLVFRADHIGLYDAIGFEGFINKLSEGLADDTIGIDQFHRMTQLIEEATIDSQGRVVIPKKMRDHIDLRPGPISVYGHGGYLAIFPKSETEQELNAAYGDATDLAGDFKALKI